MNYQPRIDAYTSLLMESMSLLTEASAREIYDKFLSKKLPEPAYLALLGMDQTAGKAATLEASTKGKYTDWLVTQYLRAPSKDRFLREDAEQIKDGLIVFDKLVKNKEGLSRLASMLGLPDGQVPERDIMKYDVTKVRSLSKIVDDQSVGVKDENNVKVLLNTDKFTIVIPLTHQASRKWGTGTNWCTATSNSYHYNEYTKTGPLFIIVEKKPDGSHGRKWQYHASSNQFMNMEDRPVSKRSWFESFAAKGPDWEDAVDQVAETLEKNGCPKFSLAAIFTPVVIADNLTGLPKNKIPYARNSDGYVLTTLATKGTFDEFLELYEYLGRPAAMPCFREILLRPSNAFSAPRKQHILDVLKLIDDVDPSLIPGVLDNRINGIDFGLVSSSFESFRTVALTTLRLPVEDRLDAIEFLFLHDERPWWDVDEDEDQNEAVLRDSVKELLANRGGDQVLLDLFCQLFQETKLTEARARPKNAIKDHLDAGQKKKNVSDLFVLLMKALKPVAGALPRTMAFLRSNGKAVNFSEDVKTKSAEEVIFNLMKTGEPLSEEDKEIIMFERTGDFYSSKVDLFRTIFKEDKENKRLCERLLPAKAKDRKDAAMKLVTSEDVANKALFTNIEYTTLALACFYLFPKSQVAQALLRSSVWKPVMSKLQSITDLNQIVTNDISAINEIIPQDITPSTRLPSGLIVRKQDSTTFWVHEPSYIMDGPKDKKIKVNGATINLSALARVLEISVSLIKVFRKLTERLDEVVWKLKPSYRDSILSFSTTQKKRAAK